MTMRKRGKKNDTPFLSLLIFSELLYISSRKVRSLFMFILYNRKTDLTSFNSKHYNTYQIKSVITDFHTKNR